MSRNEWLFLVFVVVGLVALYLRRPIAFFLAAVLIGGGLLVSWALKKNQAERMAARQRFLNLRRDLRGAHVPAEVSKGFDGVADLIEELLPRLKRYHPENRLTLTVEAMVDRDLPRIVTSYLSLSWEARARQAKQFSALFSSLAAQLTVIRDSIDNQVAGQMESQSLELEHRLSSDALDI